MRPVEVEQVLCAHVEQAVGVHVGTRIPSPRPARFARLSRLGGTRHNMVMSRPLVLVECWDVAPGGAWSLASDVYAVLDDLQGWVGPYAPGGVTVGPIWVEEVLSISEPRNTPDAESQAPRYQMNYQIVVSLDD